MVWSFDFGNEDDDDAMYERKKEIDDLVFFWLCLVQTVFDKVD